MGLPDFKWPVKWHQPVPSHHKPVIHHNTGFKVLWPMGQYSCGDAVDEGCAICKLVVQVQATNCTPHNRTVSSYKGNVITVATHITYMSPSRYKPAHHTAQGVGMHVPITLLKVWAHHTAQGMRGMHCLF